MNKENIIYNYEETQFPTKANGKVECSLTLLSILLEVLELQWNKKEKQMAPQNLE